MARRVVSHYNILGVEPTATAEEVKSAYKIRIAKHHPDRNTAADAPMLAALINEAYDVVGDPTRRVVYDVAMGFASFGRADVGVDPPHPAPSGEPARDDNVPHYQCLNVAVRWLPAVVTLGFIVAGVVAMRLVADGSADAIVSRREPRTGRSQSAPPAPAATSPTLRTPNVFRPFEASQKVDEGARLQKPEAQIESSTASVASRELAGGFDKWRAQQDASAAALAPQPASQAHTADPAPLRRSPQPPPVVSTPTPTPHTVVDPQLVATVEGLSQDEVRAGVGTPSLVQTEANGTTAWYYDRSTGSIKIYFRDDVASENRHVDAPPPTRPTSSRRPSIEGLSPAEVTRLWGRASWSKSDPDGTTTLYYDTADGTVMVYVSRGRASSVRPR